MSWEAVQDLKRRRKDVEFWANITPHIVPFNNHLFNELTKIQSGVSEFSANKKQIKNNRSRSVSRDLLRGKETQTPFEQTSLEKYDKTTQTQFSCTCLDKNEQKFDGLVLTGKSMPEDVRISNDFPFKNNVVTDINPGSKLRLTDVQHSKSCEFPETDPIKKCYVVVEKLRLEKETSNKTEQPISCSMNTEDIATDSIVGSGHCSKELFLRRDEKLKMIPRIFLRRVGESVDFLRCLDLRPKWKNTNIFQSPIRPKKLGRSRKEVR